MMLVDDVARTVAFYRDVLGFEPALCAPAGEPLAWAVVRRGVVELLVQSRAALAAVHPALAERRAEPPMTVYLDVPDVEVLYERARRRAPVTELRRGADGRREFAVVDPDGVVLVFAGERLRVRSRARAA